MIKITPKKYAISLYQALQQASEEKTDEVVKNFVSLIIDNKAVSQINKIIKAYRQYANEQEGVVELTIISVDALDEKLKQGIVTHLEQDLQKKIEMHEEHDPSLMGGAVIRYGDTVIDGSVKNRLVLLSKTLKK